MVHHYLVNFSVPRYEKFMSCFLTCVYPKGWTRTGVLDTFQVKMQPGPVEGSLTMTGQLELDDF